MPTTDENIKKIRKQREKQSDLISEAGDYSATAGGLQETIMDAVQQDRAQRGVSQLAQDVGNTMGQLATDPAGIRERTGDMVDPFSVNFLTAQQRGQNLRTLGTLATQKQDTQGNIFDTIEANASRLKSIAAQKLAEAEQASAEADNMLNELYYQLDERKQDFAEAKARGDYDTGGSYGGAGSSQDFVDMALDYGESLGLTGEDLLSFNEDVNGTIEDVESGIMTPEQGMRRLRMSWGTQSVDPQQEAIATARSEFERTQPGFLLEMATTPNYIPKQIAGAIAELHGRAKSKLNQLRARQNK